MRALAAIVLGSFFLAAPGLAEVLIDRIVATVDDDPIYLSDLEQLPALGLTERRPGESDAAFYRRLLDGLIDERLRLHEMGRFESAPAPAAAVEEQVEKIRAQFADTASFLARLAAVGLDLDGLRQLLGQQIKILSYIDERLGPRIFVGLDDIRAYYDGELVRELKSRGLERPPFDEIRDDIRRFLHQVRLDQEIVRWTEELRSKADIVDHLERSETPLPPLVERFERPPSPPMGS